MNSLLLLQVALPVVLLAWLVVRPMRSRSGLALQIASLTVVIFALLVAGVWMFPPWWTPLVYLAVLFVAGLGAAMRLSASGGPTPRSAGERLAAAAFAGLAIYAGWTVADGLSGGRPPGPLVPLSLPLAGGPYMVVNGGSTAAVNAHRVTGDPEHPGHRAFRGQSHGVDIVKLNPWGAASAGVLPRRPQAYAIFGEAILAPCAGRVIAVVDDVEDSPVPHRDIESPAGNHVRLRCGEYEVVLAHMTPGSVAVAPGQTVWIGDPVGRVGSTGNTDAPHLHIHAQRPAVTNNPLAGDPVPISIGGRYLVRGDRLSAPR